MPERKILIRVLSDASTCRAPCITCDGCGREVTGTCHPARRAEVIRVVDTEAMAIGSSNRGSDEWTYYPEFEFCPKCSKSDEIVAEMIVKFYRDVFFGRVKNVDAIQFEFYHEKEPVVEVVTRVRKAKSKPKTKTKTYMVGIHERHVSWRRVTVPASADKDEIEEAALFGATEERLEYYSEVIDVPPEIYEDDA